jgi:hypothetical protein
LPKHGRTAQFELYSGTPANLYDRRWRAVYLFSLVPALIILVLRFRLEESPRFSAVLSELRRTNSRRVGMVEASRDRSFRRSVLVGFLIFVSLTYAFYAMAFYIPAYVDGLSPTTGVTIVATIFEIGGLIGGLTGGIAGDLIGRRLPAMAVRGKCSRESFGPVSRGWRGGE